MHLTLDVGDAEWSEDVLYDYYAFAQSRRRDHRPNRDWRPVERTPGYVLALDDLTSNGDPTVEEPVPDPLHDALDAYDGTLDADGLDDLVADLRDAADEHAEFHAETGPLAVAEFARDHDLSVDIRD